MTQLRQKCWRNSSDYSHRTAKTYVRIVYDFAAHFHRPPDQLGPEHIRQYQAYLFQSKKVVGGYDVSSVGTLRGLHAGT